jgi:hypothetical protein
LQRIYSDLIDPGNKLDIAPAWVEPIFGLQNQLTWKRWYLIIQGDYGGYFVASKHSFQLTANMYFRTGKFTSVKVGWNHLYLDYHGTFLKEDYKAELTLSGPAAGIVFQF